MKLLSPKIDSPPFLRWYPQRAPLWYAAHSQMRPRVKRLPVTFSARFRADLEDFLPVKILAELREDRLSGKKCTFGHSVLFGYNFTGH